MTIIRPILHRISFSLLNWLETKFYYKGIKRDGRLMVQIGSLNSLAIMAFGMTGIFRMLLITIIESGSSFVLFGIQK